MTSSSNRPANPIDVEDVRTRVNAALAAFMDGQSALLGKISPQLVPAADALRDFLLDGGKRLRPAFCYWGWRAAAVRPGARGSPTRRPHWSCCRPAPWCTTT